MEMKILIFACLLGVAYGARPRCQAYDDIRTVFRKVTGRAKYYTVISTPDCTQAKSALVRGSNRGAMRCVTNDTSSYFINDEHPGSSNYLVSLCYKVKHVSNITYLFTGINTFKQFNVEPAQTATFETICIPAIATPLTENDSFFAIIITFTIDPQYRFFVVKNLNMKACQFDIDRLEA